MPKKSLNILGKKLLVVVAHPDDESFLAAGTLRRNAEEGGINYLICASLGALGTSYVSKTVTKTELKKIRKEELMTVCNELKIKHFKILNFPDSGIQEYTTEFKKYVLDFADVCLPDYIISFGPDGYTGHRDHITAGKVSKWVASRMKIPFIQFTKPCNELCKALGIYLKIKQKKGNYKECKEETAPNIHIQVDAIAKLRTLALYKSQFAGLNPYKTFPQKIADHILQNEYFYVSKP